MSFPLKGLYRFDEFELNPSGRALLRNGKPVVVSPKAFEVLTYLVANPGRVVTKEELLQAVWPDSFVEEGNLPQHISWLRKALGDKANYIVTVSGRGYQFTAKVQAEPPPELVPAQQTGDIIVQRVRERTHMVIEESSPAPLPALTARVSSRTWPYVLVMAGVLALAAGAVWKWSRPPTPNEYHQIVLADFINTTGDATFDRTLRRALEITLEQSPYMDVMSEGESVSTMRQMGRKGDEAITPDVAREVCERTNRQVLITGSIASVGSQYLLTLEAADCDSGKVLASAKEQAAGKEKVLGALDAIAERVRTRLGETAKSVESFQVPVEQATTSSLEALKSYSMGRYLDAQGKGPAQSLPFYQRAVELDPQFVEAIGMMAVYYYNYNENKKAAEYFQKAFDLSNRVSEREKLLIQAFYYAASQKDLEQAIKTYQVFVAVYPRDSVAWVNLSDEYTQLGQYAPAIVAGERALQLDTKASIKYSDLARAYKCANRFADAKSVGALAVQRGKDSSGLQGSMFEIAFAEHDQNALAQEIKWRTNHPDDWYFMEFGAFAAAATGKYREAEELFHNTYETAVRQNMAEAADDILVDEARTEFDLGQPAASRATLSRIRKSDTDSPDLAILRAELGDASFAEQFLAAHSNETHNTLMTFFYLPRLRATLARERGKPLDAVAALVPAIPFQLADYTVLSERGEAYLQAKQPELAAEEYKKVLANPGVDAVSSLYPLAHLALARAYAQENNQTASRNEYEKLFAYWKDADAYVPVLKQARWEYAHLQ